MSLPDQLKPGTQIRTASGVIATVVRTAQRDKEYDTPLYRLRYGAPEQYKVTSKKMWTRDQLAEEGCEMHDS